MLFLLTVINSIKVEHFDSWKPVQHCLSVVMRVWSFIDGVLVTLTMDDDNDVPVLVLRRSCFLVPDSLFLNVFSDVVYFSVSAKRRTPSRSVPSCWQTSVICYSERRLSVRSSRRKRSNESFGKW